MVRDMPVAARGILSYFARHRTLANLLFVLLVILGLAAVPNMRTQFFPDIVYQNVNVTITWEGASAEDIDRGVIQVLEPALLSVDGIMWSSASAREGSGGLYVTFEPGWDMARAADDIQTALDSITDLPEDIDEPKVDRAVWRDRVTDVVVSGPVSPEQLGLFADELVVRLFRQGVTRTTLRGVAAPRIIIEVSSAQLMSNKITMAEIASAIAAEVDADPAGDIADANLRVRMGVEKRDPAEISNIILRSNDDGSKLKVGDIAQISRAGADREIGYFVGENPAISIRVDRTVKGDAVAIQRKVERVAEELQATLPEGVTVELIRTRAAAISARLDILIDNGLMGLGLVVCLLFLFLNARTALWVAAGIPVAMLTAIAIMYAGGLTFNMVSLFGLIITLGIVVDDAIVVGEHADYRARHFGESPVEAAENAARRMAMPVFAATLTTVIAFSGLVLIGGRFGTMIQDIPLTVIAVLVASLVECFLILPNHMVHALAARAKDRWYDWPSRQVNRGFVAMREKLFRPFMAYVIAARYVVLAAVVLVLASQLALFIRGDVPWRFFNAPERGSVSGNFVMVEGATRADSVEMMREMQRATEELAREYEERYGLNPVDYVLTVVGENAGRRIGGTDGKNKDLLGGISIELIDPELRPYSSSAFVSDLQERVVRHPLAETVTFRGWRSGPGDDGLKIRFFGAEAEVLKVASLELQAALQRYPEISALEDSLAFDKEELVLNLTPQGQALGFKVDDLGRALRHRLEGIEAATYPEGPRSVEIRVELPQGELTADFLERTQMRSPSGAYIPLADIVSVERRLGFNSVTRENGLRVVSVTGDLSEDDPERATEIENQLRTEILPSVASTHQVQWQMAGQSQQENEFLNDASTGFILCLTGIFVVLAWIFSSWSRPFIVMAIIPFGLVGTIYGHWVWDVPMSMFTVVGLLGMTGIIINDSIVLVTTIDEYAQDRGLIPSIIDGAADRLRPVLLTTLTTVLGMTPLLFETSTQAQFLKPTVITLVYGLGFGMVLVLLVVPALMAVQHDFSRHITALRRASLSPSSGLRSGFAALWILILGWFAVTMGWAIWAGQLMKGFTLLSPTLQNAAPLPASLALFVMGTAAISLLAYAIFAVVLSSGLKRNA